MSTNAGDLPAGFAVDNDIVLKAVCYGLTMDFWPPDGEICDLGVLGAAQFVVRDRIESASLARNKSEALAELDALIACATVLEPTADELLLAAEMETIAQREGIPLDAGESQLAAMVVHRDIQVLETGDKRAIRGMELLLDRILALGAINGKVRCLEQKFRRLLDDPALLGNLAAAVCGEAWADKALSICFSCTSPNLPALTDVLEGLESYITALRNEAPRVLVA